MVREPSICNLWWRRRWRRRRRSCVCRRTLESVIMYLRLCKVTKVSFTVSPPPPPPPPALSVCERVCLQGESTTHYPLPTTHYPLPTTLPGSGSETAVLQADVTRVCSFQTTRLQRTTTTCRWRSSRSAPSFTEGNRCTSRKSLPFVLNLRLQNE